MPGSFDDLERIMRAYKWTLEQVTQANGYNTDVTLVDEIDTQIRDGTLGAGVVVLITEGAQEFEHRPGSFVRGYLDVEIEAWIRETDTATLRTTVRGFRADLWEAIESDPYLAVADAGLGGPGTQLLVRHYVATIEPEYGPPDAILTARVEAEYDFPATSS